MRIMTDTQQRLSRAGISEEERAQCDAWIESVGLGAPVSCDDAGFCAHHDAFAFMPFAADCQTYVFYPLARLCS